MLVECGLDGLSELSGFGVGWTTPVSLIFASVFLLLLFLLLLIFFSVVIFIIFYETHKNMFNFENKLFFS